MSMNYYTYVGPFATVLITQELEAIRRMLGADNVEVKWGVVTYSM